MNQRVLEIEKAAEERIQQQQLAHNRALESMAIPKQGGCSGDDCEKRLAELKKRFEALEAQLKKVLEQSFLEMELFYQNLSDAIFLTTQIE